MVKVERKEKDNVKHYNLDDDYDDDDDDGEIEKKDDNVSIESVNDNSLFSSFPPNHVFSSSSALHLKQIGDFCLSHSSPSTNSNSKTSSFHTAEDCFSIANDTSSLFLLSTITGDEDLLKFLAKGKKKADPLEGNGNKNETEDEKKYVSEFIKKNTFGLTNEDNLTLSSLFLTRDVDGCVDFLLSLSNTSSASSSSSSSSYSPLRAAEAAFFARAYAPWRMQECVVFFFFKLIFFFFLDCME
jgi:hypothetical protein